MNIEAKKLLAAKSHFAFGKNWLDYSRKINEEMITQAICDLQRLSGRERFDGLAFLDIGCGSGLHSLAASRMGASRVVGVDIDPDSVAAAKETFARFAPGSNAIFREVSVFDMTPKEYGGFDVVYSWGVLHHTGDMYEALRAAAALVGSHGLFMVALYKKTPFCGMWRVIKRWYSSASETAQRRAMSIYILVRRMVFLIQGRNFDAHVRAYSRNRGMDYYNDVHDWIGGYPYESIDPQECRDLFAKFGFAVQNEFIQPAGRFLSGLMGSGCDEFVFQRLPANVVDCHSGPPTDA